MTFTHDHIHLRCQDMAATEKFYCRMLGGRVIDRRDTPGKEMIRLEVGGIVLTLKPGDPDQAPPAPGEPRWGAYELGFQVPDLDQAMVELRAKGAQFIDGPIDFLPGLRIAFMKAPDGMQVEILQRG